MNSGSSAYAGSSSRRQFVGCDSRSAERWKDIACVVCLCSIRWRQSFVLLLLPGALAGGECGLGGELQAPSMRSSNATKTSRDALKRECLRIS